MQPDTNISTDLPDLELCFKMFALLYVDDAELLSEIEPDLQKALDVTTEYCHDNNMTNIVPETKICLFCVEKAEKRLIYL